MFLRALTVRKPVKVRIPMRDGVELGADLYQPRNPLGTLLVRGPYGRGLIFSLLMARVYVAHGYRVLFVSSRGTYDSAGAFDPMRDEAADGQDVVAWMREQQWFTGTFATVGGSYLGHTQWALLDDPPPELVAAVITVGPHDFARHAWGTGAFNLDFVGWTDMIVSGRSRAGSGVERVLSSVPLADAADEHFGDRAPWFRYRATHPDISDPYWAPMRHPLDRATIPILLLSGWQDLFLGQTFEQYDALRARGVDVALTVGPWTHVDVIGRGSRTLLPQAFDWLDEHLAGRIPRSRPTPVRIVVTGAGEWRDLPAWPPATTSRAFALCADKALTMARPEAESDGDATVASFTFDPAAPTPTVGGPLITGGGVTDDSALAARTDVAAFTTDPLDRDLEILGAPTIILRHGTDNPHADLFVRLSDVDPDGRSHNVTETYLRLDPARDETPIVLTLLPCAHRFRAGHRVRVLVAGGSHPQYARNLGTDENPGTGSRLVPSRHTIRAGSTLTLPDATA